MIKDIVVNLSVGTDRDVAANYAVSLGALLSSHVAGIAFTYEPLIPATVMGGIPSEVIAAQRNENESAAHAAAERFSEHAKRVGIQYETRILEATVAGSADAFGLIARRADLAVVAQAQPEHPLPEELIVEGALFNSGRPVIVVPYIQRSDVKLDLVTVCWDGSRTSARAIGDAMPILKKARAVEVLIVANDASKKSEVPGADMGQHLARHDINVDVKRITASGIDVGSAILSHIADSGTDLVVMGGYGHSRLREFILGGVTRSLLASMTAPVLMSH